MRGWHRPWVWADVIVPVVVVRLSLLLAGWLTQSVLPNPKYGDPDAPGRGWHFTANRLLDMWARWDAGWYFGLVREGYEGGPVVDGVHGKFAFFPLYPALVRLFALLLPERLQSTQRLLIIGLLLSNVFLIAALIILHKLVASFGDDRELARRTVLYTLLFPTGFFLFCFYTEATFLLLSVGAFYAATRRAWWLAGLLGGLLSLTRPLGILVCVPLAWMYLESIDWSPKKLRPGVLWLALTPAPLLAYLLYAYRMTGDLLAPVHAQAMWDKKFTPPWATLFRPYGGDPYVTGVEQVLAVVFLALAVWALFKLPSAAYGLYALLLILPPLTSGTLLSTSRYYVVVFPALVMLAWLGKHPSIDGALRVVLLAVQICFMVMWARFYWVA